MEPALDENFIDIHQIFIKIAPYLSNPNIIKKFLKRNSKITKNKLKKVIEKEIKKSDSITKTDLRILLNSI